jgi:Uma2 family endonuclease
MATVLKQSYKERVFTLEELNEVMADPERAKELPEHFEIIKGRIVEMAPAAQDQGFTAGDMIVILGSYVRSKNLGRITAGELGFKLKADPVIVCCPDLAFISKDRVPPKENRTGYFDGAPDLAIEVVSPGNTISEINDKVALYLGAGSKLVWVVNPEREEVQIFRPGDHITSEILRAEDEISGEEVIKGFSCRVAEFFE